MWEILDLSWNSNEVVIDVHVVSIMFNEPGEKVSKSQYEQKTKRVLI